MKSTLRFKIIETLLGAKNCGIVEKRLSLSVWNKTTLLDGKKQHGTEKIFFVPKKETVGFENGL